jgi:phosphatidylglycerophosphatase A
VAVAVATAGGVGFAPWAPGTFGAALAVTIFVLSSPLGPAPIAALGLGLLGVGAWASDVAERAFGRKDDGRIVIDEVVGQLAALAPLLAAGQGARTSAAGLVTAFVAFRVFDIWKPGPVRWAERAFRGGIGVMMDDVVAGLLGAGVVGGLVALGAFAS